MNNKQGGLPAQAGFIKIIVIIVVIVIILLIMKYNHITISGILKYFHLTWPEVIAWFTKVYNWLKDLIISVK